MISGFNTDILHKGVVFHVQTEDKGRSNPVIHSIIYVGGQVVISKEESYADLLEHELGDREIAERMDRQHRVLMAAIKSGRFDDQFRQALEAAGEELPPTDEPSAAAQIDALVDALESAVRTGASVTDSAIERARLKVTSSDKKLDEVVLDYLKAEQTRERLMLAMAENGPVELGSRAQLELRTTSSTTGEPIDGARVTVRMISTVREPQILGEGTTAGGKLSIEVEIPTLERGSAALIVSASSELGRAEVRRLL